MSMLFLCLPIKGHLLEMVFVRFAMAIGLKIKALEKKRPSKKEGLNFFSVVLLSKILFEVHYIIVVRRTCNNL
jgi:hypothetical protein